MLFWGWLGAMEETRGQDRTTIRFVIYRDQARENTTRNTGVREGGLGGLHPKTKKSFQHTPLHT